MGEKYLPGEIGRTFFYSDLPGCVGALFVSDGFSAEKRKISAMRMMFDV